MSMQRILIRFSHGLGDAVQLTAVFRHLKKYRPDWQLFLLAKRGKHSAGYGWCERVWHDQEPPPDERQFHHVFDLGWYENYNAYRDRPNTKVTNCLTEVFHLPWDTALSQYQLHLSEEALARTRQYLESIGCRRLPSGKYNATLFHYQGNTSTEKKNVSHGIIGAACQLLLEMDYVPIILDWDWRSPLPDQKTIFNPGIGPDDLWGNFGSGDAERITALIQQSALFVGIDSGPQKCAGATDTPSIGLWTRHSPVQFMDLCSNFTHLVPDDFHTIPPCQDRGVAEYFIHHYDFRTYRPDRLMGALCGLIQDKLGCRREVMGDLQRMAGFCCPTFHPEQSWVIIWDIYLQDAYKTSLRPKRQGVEYVVDLGANIGCFARLWHERNPQAKIACVEVNDKLIPALTANAGEYATIINKACHYGAEDLFLLDTFTPAGESTGGSRVVTRAELEAESQPQYRKGTAPLETITLEQLMTQLGWPRIDVLKLDVEGSEYSILGHCDLGKIHTIFLESHGHDRWMEFMTRRFPPEQWDIGHMSRGGSNGDFSNWHLVQRERSA